MQSGLYAETHGSLWEPRGGICYKVGVREGFLKEVTF